MFHSSIRSLLCLCSLMIAGARQVWLLHAKILSRVPMVFSGRGVPGKIPLVYLAVFAVAWQWGELPGDKVSGTAFADPVVHVLSGPSDHLTIAHDGKVHLVYGTTGNNQVTVAHGAVAHLRHFPGENTIHIQTNISQCIAVRSGAMVTIRDYQGTLVKIPATAEAQTLDFNGTSRTLQINGGQVYLDNFQITLNTQPIAQGELPVVTSTTPANGAAGVEVDTSITIHFSKIMDPSTLIPDNFALGKIFGPIFSPIAFTLSKTDTSVILRPDSSLAYNRTYRVVVKTGVQDTSGNHLAQEKRVPFTTEELQAGTEKIIALGNGVDLTLVWVPPGSFYMGSFSSDPDAEDYEKPCHEVTLTQGFWMGKYEVTQAQWKQIMGLTNNPSGFQGNKRPVENITWDEVQEFIAVLNQATGETFSLPTEAQWEYAARGDASPRQKYSGSDDADPVGWHDGNSNHTTHEVGQKDPNAWGLHDMSGNVDEWCQDWYGTYPSGSVTDPTGPDSSGYRVYRGGNFSVFPHFLRSACRNGYPTDYRYENLGFRLVMQP